MKCIVHMLTEQIRDISSKPLVKTRLWNYFLSILCLILYYFTTHRYFFMWAHFKLKILICTHWVMLLRQILLFLINRKGNWNQERLNHRVIYLISARDRNTTFFWSLVCIWIYISYLHFFIMKFDYLAPELL